MLAFPPRSRVAIEKLRLRLEPGMAEVKARRLRAKARSIRRTGYSIDENGAIRQ